MGPATGTGECLLTCWLCGNNGERYEALNYMLHCPTCDVIWIARACDKDGYLPKVKYDYQMWRGQNGCEERLPYADFSQPGPPHAPA